MALTTASTQSIGAASPVANPDIATDLAATCTVFARTATPDGSGGRSINYTSVATGVWCRIKRIDGMDKSNHGGKVIKTVRATGEFDIAAPLTDSSRIQIGDDIWDVIELDEGVSGALVITASLVKR